MTLRSGEFARALLEAKKSLYTAFVSGVNDAEVGEVSFLLLSLLGENVTFESMFSLNLPRSGQSKSLFRATHCLHLWHFLKF